jgi:hypothetical protein
VPATATARILPVNETGAAEQWSKMELMDLKRKMSEIPQSPDRPSE